MNNQEIRNKLISLGMISEEYSELALNIVVCAYHLQELVDHKLLAGGKISFTDKGRQLGKLLVDIGFKITADDALKFLHSTSDMFEEQIIELFPSIANTMYNINQHGIDWLFEELMNMTANMTPEEIERLRNQSKEM